MKLLLNIFQIHSQIWTITNKIVTKHIPNPQKDQQKIKKNRCIRTKNNRWYLRFLISRYKLCCLFCTHLYQTFPRIVDSPSLSSSNAGVKQAVKVLLHYCFLFETLLHRNQQGISLQKPVSPMLRTVTTLSSRMQYQFRCREEKNILLVFGLQNRNPPHPVRLL